MHKTILKKKTQKKTLLVRHYFCFANQITCFYTIRIFAERSFPADFSNVLFCELF